MEKYEKLKLEYSLLEVEDFIVDKVDALSMITIFIDDQDDFKLETIKDAKECNKSLFIARLRGLITFNNEEVNYYKEQLNNVTNKFDLILKGINYQNKLRNIVNDDNYFEIYKLSKFLDHNLTLNYNFINLQIDSLYFNHIGLNYIYDCSDYASDNKEELFKFLDDNISKYQVKQIEKVKKM